MICENDEGRNSLVFDNNNAIVLPTLKIFECKWTLCSSGTQGIEFPGTLDQDN